jgi:hypothetical protein
MKGLSRYGPLVAGILLAIQALLRVLDQVEAAQYVEQHAEEIAGAIVSLMSAVTLLWGAARKLRSVFTRKQE